jgi:hypothetical protein
MVHPLSSVLTHLCASSNPDRVLIIHVKDGETFRANYYAPNLSYAGFAVFGANGNGNGYEIVAVPWDSIQRVEMSNLETLPMKLFK